MVTTSRKFELIIRSRAAASPFLIFAASSISCSSVKSGIRPISRRYLLSPVSVSFMIRNVFTGASPPLLRTWGIFSCRYRDVGCSLFRHINGPTTDDCRSCQNSSLERSYLYEIVGLGRKPFFDRARDSHSSRRDCVGYYRAAGANAGGVLGRDRDFSRHAIHRRRDADALG